jgi:hypothetical protein
MTLRPTLVVMVWRGGERWRRCLDSISATRHHFERVLISVTAASDSQDLRLSHEFARDHDHVEVICTGRELPTMQHQAFWVDHLERTGTAPDEWIYWLAYDDQVRGHGIDAIVDSHGNWPLHEATAYFGPWAMRHESGDSVYAGPWDAELESWTAFPQSGPTRLSVLAWIGHQLAQPTYMQMSGSVATFASFKALRDSQPPKIGPMRIEMAIAAAPPNRFVQEFAQPISVIYGRPNSDRASYGAAARREDLHLARWLGQYLRRHPGEWKDALQASGATAASYARSLLLARGRPQEEWRVRGTVIP